MSYILYPIIQSWIKLGKYCWMKRTIIIEFCKCNDVLRRWTAVISNIWLNIFRILYSLFDKLFPVFIDFYSKPCAHSKSQALTSAEDIQEFPYELKRSGYFSSDQQKIMHQMMHFTSLHSTVKFYKYLHYLSRNIFFHTFSEHFIMQTDFWNFGWYFIGFD